MEQETQRYYEDLFSLFASDGWKHVIQGLEGERARLNNVEQIPDAETLRFIQGQLHAIVDILGLEEGARLAYDQIIQGESGEDL